mgnify:CR=1 FL=1
MMGEKIMNRVLIIDDDVELCDLLKDYLKAEGFAVNAAHRSETGLELCFQGDFNLVILDVMRPGMNGFDLLRKIREASRIPVIMLTARGDDVDRIVGLEMGADDYLAKPFNPRELVARIRAVQRRTASSPVSSSGAAASQATVLRAGDVTLDPLNQRATSGGAELGLTSVEFSLLYELMKVKGRVVSRDELAEKVLGRKLTMFDRSIDVHVSSLRKKLAGEGKLADPSDQPVIKSIRGVGYLFTVFTPTPSSM